MFRLGTQVTLSEGLISLGLGADDLLSGTTAACAATNIATNFDIGVEVRHVARLGFVFAFVCGK
jgi:hypothetical protein